MTGTVLGAIAIVLGVAGWLFPRRRRGVLVGDVPADGAISFGIAELPGPEVDDDRCCALRAGHDGCCAFLCWSCGGAGEMGCDWDDLGCDCGFCDGYGGCPECDGYGWHNDNDEPCVVMPDELPPGGDRVTTEIVGSTEAGARSSIGDDATDDGVST